MAKDKADKAAQNQADRDLLDILLGQGGVELRLERTIYAAEECGDVPLVGFFYDLLDMPPIEGKKGEKPRDWQAFVVRTTYESKGKDREGNVVPTEAGEEVIIPATFQIAQALARFARDPEFIHEIGLKPKAAIDIGGGRSLWTYRVIATGKKEQRTTAYALTQKAAAAPAQFPAGSGNAAVPAAGQAVPVPATGQA